MPALGIASNRELAILEKLIACLRDPGKNALAQKLLTRYTREPPICLAKAAREPAGSSCFKDSDAFKKNRQYHLRQWFHNVQL